MVNSSQGGVNTHPRSFYFVSANFVDLVLLTVRTVCLIIKVAFIFRLESHLIEDKSFRYNPNYVILPFVHKEIVLVAL